MGCQNSKLHADILAIPPKLRPILWRRFEELRSRRRNGVVGGTTISKKELLKDNKVYLLPSSIDENESSKSISMDDSVSSSVSRQKPDKTKPETMEETDNNQEIKEDENEESYIEKAVKAETVEKMVVVEEGGDEEEEEEEEEEERGNLGPGSPSFRVYFIEASLGEKDNVKNDSKDGKLCRAKSVDSIVLLETHEEDQETKTMKKRMKNRTRITRAICRGPVAVKHLLSVSSCYHPSNDRATLLTKKSAT